MEQFKPIYLNIHHITCDFYNPNIDFTAIYFAGANLAGNLTNPLCDMFWVQTSIYIQDEICA